jgi:hypothetical protein
MKRLQRKEMTQQKTEARIHGYFFTGQRPNFQALFWIQLTFVIATKNALFLHMFNSMPIFKGKITFFLN